MQLEDSVPTSIYVLKIKRGGWDGWGRDLPQKEVVLGSYSEREKAYLGKLAYELLDGKDLKMFDCGKPWVEESAVQ